MTLIGAETKPQLDQTAKDMFFKVFPDFMIEQYLKQKDMVICKNGHIILFKPLDDEGKLRSLNLTGFWINESVQIKPIENGGHPNVKTRAIPCQV